VSDIIGNPWRPTGSAPPRVAAPPTPPPTHPEPEPDPARHWWQRKRVWAAVTVLLLVGGLAAAYLAWQQVEEKRRVVEAERARFAEYLSTRESPFQALDDLTGAQLQALRRSPNVRHVELGQQHGITPIPRRDDVPRVVQEAGLLPVRDTPAYWVARLTHSHTYLTADAVAVLDSIGARFAERLAGAGVPAFRYNLSSLLRTREDQNRLRGVNINAAQGASSHEYATTFDVHYGRFRYGGDPRVEVADALGPLPYPYLYDEFARELEGFYNEMAQRYPTRLGAVLGRVMIELENEGLLVVVREQRQPVYHATVARRLAGG
jgi:hypothetical protein